MKTENNHRAQSTADTDTQSSNQCPECGGTISTNANDEDVCGVCGLIIDEYHIDHGPEWGRHDKETRKRTGPPVTVTKHDNGLSTKIGYNRDAKGNTLSAGKQKQMARLRKAQARGRWESKRERNLGYGLGEVQRISSALNLSDSLREQACQVYRSVYEKDIFSGRSIDAFAAASVYATCRCNEHPFTIEDIVNIARADQTRVSNTYNELNRELALPARPRHPDVYIPRIVSELELSQEIQRRATELATRPGKEYHPSGCNPSGIAAACVYLAVREEGANITQSTVAEVANVSSPTVRKRRNEINTNAFI